MRKLFTLIIGLLLMIGTTSCTLEKLESLENDQFDPLTVDPATEEAEEEIEEND